MVQSIMGKFPADGSQGGHSGFCVYDARTGSRARLRAAILRNTGVTTATAAIKAVPTNLVDATCCKISRNGIGVSMTQTSVTKVGKDRRASSTACANKQSQRPPKMSLSSAVEAITWASTQETRCSGLARSTHHVKHTIQAWRISSHQSKACLCGYES